jgi:Domain of unknown function (DUF4386)
MDFIVDVSPRRLARIAGALGVTNILFGAFAVGVVPAMLVVSGNPAATAHDILAHETLYRSGLAAHLVVLFTNLVLTVVSYELFKVVSRPVALLDAFVGLVATAVETTSVLNQFTLLVALGSGAHGGVVPAAQLQALVHVPGDPSSDYTIYEVFYGFGFLVTTSYLLLRSWFLPRILGVLTVIDGLGYLVHGFASLLAPDFATHLVPWIQFPVVPAEGSLWLWLLIAGVNVERWRAQASANVRARSMPAEAVLSALERG